MATSPPPGRQTRRLGRDRTSPPITAGADRRTWFGAAPNTGDGHPAAVADPRAREAVGE
jgi:hypothetical protein